MGNLQAAAYAEGVAEGWASLRQAVGANLRSNHFPPIDIEYVEPVIDAIQAIEEGEPERMIRLPGTIRMVPRTAEPADELLGGWLIDAATLVEITHSHGFIRQD